MEYTNQKYIIPPGIYNRQLKLINIILYLLILIIVSNNNKIKI